MGKRRSPILAKVSNLIKVSIFIAKMRLVYLKKSTKLSKFRSLKHYNSYGWLQEHQFSPSNTPLIQCHRQKTNRSDSVYSVCFFSCFGGGRGVVMLDENINYSLESAAIVEVERDGSELLYEYGEQEEDDDDDDSVDERAEKFIQRFYEEMKRQRRESSSSADLPLNRLLEY